MFALQNFHERVSSSNPGRFGVGSEYLRKTPASFVWCFEANFGWIVQWCPMAHFYMYHFVVHIYHIYIYISYIYILYIYPYVHIRYCMSPFLFIHFKWLVFSHSQPCFLVLLRYREPLSLLRASSGLGEHGTAGGFHGVILSVMVNGESPFLILLRHWKPW